eukprot:g20358.t1
MEALHMALDQLGKAVDLEYEVTCELPPEKVSAMIGPGGQIVRNVRQSTSTSIHFSEVSGAREQTMHIKGPLLGVYRAHVMMMRRYHEHEAELQFPPKGASRPGVKGESKGGYEKGYDRSYGKGHDGKGYGKGYEKGKGGGCDGKGFDRGYDQSREKGRFDVKGKDKGRDGCWSATGAAGAAGGHAGKSRAAAERGEGQARPLRSEAQRWDEVMKRSTLTRKPSHPSRSGAEHGGRAAERDRIVERHRQRLEQSKAQVALFLEQNDFDEVNSCKGLLTDHWGRTAYHYARGKKKILEVFQKSGCIPSSPRFIGQTKLQRTPPPAGFEEFFAKVEQDPLVQKPSNEAYWLQTLGPRKLRAKLVQKSDVTTRISL